jgi:antirestriction protein
MEVWKMEIKVYVANLGKYNEGSLVGEWFTLPVDFEEMREAIGLNDQYEEYVIHDYEAPKGISMREYTSLVELNEIAERIDALDKYEQDDLKLILESGHCAETGEALDVLENDGYRIWHECDDMSDVAFAKVEELGYLDQMPENLRRYFDYEKFGRDLAIEGSYYYVGDKVYIEFF